MEENKGKVFLVEDNQQVGKFEKMFIEDPPYGHQVMLTAASRKEALDKIQRAKEKGVNVAVLDGSLETGPGDGPAIAKVLREAIPGIIIISSSYDKVNWGDFNLLKPEETEYLGETIKKALLGRGRT